MHILGVQFEKGTHPCPSHPSQGIRHFHHVGEVSSDLNPCTLIHPLLFSTATPFDFCHHILVLSILELYTDSIIWYSCVRFFCSAECFLQVSISIYTPVPCFFT